MQTFSFFQFVHYGILQTLCFCFFLACFESFLSDYIFLSLFWCFSWCFSWNLLSLLITWVIFSALFAAASFRSLVEITGRIFRSAVHWPNSHWGQTLLSGFENHTLQMTSAFLEISFSFPQVIFRKGAIDASLVHSLIPLRNKAAVFSFILLEPLGHVCQYTSATLVMQSSHKPGITGCLLWAYSCFASPSSTREQEHIGHTFLNHMSNFVTGFISSSHETMWMLSELRGPAGVN